MTRKITGALFIVATLAFGIAATVLSSAFDWPDILREPASVVLPAFTEGGSRLIWIWFATAWTYGLLAIPILLLPSALGQRHNEALRVATYAGATSVVLSVVGFLRWVFVVPPLAAAYATDPNGVEAAWLAQHQFGGALLGEHLGQLLAIAWSITLSVVVLQTRALPRWLGVTGLVASGLYLLNQGDILATALPDFPVWDLAGLIGSTAWALWLLALGSRLCITPRTVQG